MNSPLISRRHFVRQSVVGGVGLAAGLRAATLGGTARADVPRATVAITKGPDRADNAFRGMQMFKKDIAAAIGNKRIIIKPNFVWDQLWNGIYLPCTQVAWIEGILEFLKSIGKTHVIVAESSATGAMMKLYGETNYYSLLGKYSVQLMDLNQEGESLVKIWTYGYPNSESLPSTTIRIAKMYQNPNNFIISCPPIKTHNTVVATLSMKNVSMSAPIYDIGYPWSQSGNRGDKSSMHGPNGAPNSTFSNNSDFQVLNDNVYRMAKVFGIHPHLAVIDGFLGMQGNGPVSGTGALYGTGQGQQVGIVSLDWVAADRVGFELMGPTTSAWTNAGYVHSNTPAFPACLNYAWQAGLGQWDYSMIDVIGQPVAGNILNYTPSNGLAAQITNTPYGTPRE